MTLLSKFCFDELWPVLKAKFAFPIVKPKCYISLFCLVNGVSAACITVTAHFPAQQNVESSFFHLNWFFLIGKFLSNKHLASFNLCRQEVFTSVSCKPFIYSTRLCFLLTICLWMVLVFFLRIEGLFWKTQSQNRTQLIQDCFMCSEPRRGVLYMSGLGFGPKQRRPPQTFLCIRSADDF